MRTIVRRAALVAAATPIVLAASVGVAHAEVSNGQVLTASNYSCGWNDRVTGDTVFYGPVPTKQRALIFRNCGGSAVQRKADVDNDFDGDCYTIGAGRAKVLHTVQAIPSRKVYNGVKSC